MQRNPHSYQIATGYRTFYSLSLIYQPITKKRLFFCNKMNGIGRYDNTGGMIFFPASGQRYFSKGKVYDVGSISNIWTAVPYSMDSGYYLVSYLSCINPLNFYYRSSGYAVRPVRE